MRFDVSSLEDLRLRHVGWRLLRYERAPLAIAFLHHAFVASNARSLSEDDAIELLEDVLHSLSNRDEHTDSIGHPAHTDYSEGTGRTADHVDSGGTPSVKSARAYLMDWASDDRGFVRRFYPSGSDEAHIAVTPGAERAIAWISSLDESSFVGTESRLLTAIELLRQLTVDTDDNAAVRLDDLHRRRNELDVEIARVERGDVRLLDDRAVVERFQQFVSLSRELLADFRQVEENFRSLDRSVRERIAQWNGSKGNLLGEVFGERDLIASSDQGASFRAFWDVLSALSRQDELSERLNRVVSLPAVAALEPDRRIRRVHHDWFNAGDHTQRTVASLTAQLRRFIDDKTWLENRRIAEIIRSIEYRALEVRNNRPSGAFTSLDSAAADIRLPMERRLAAPPTIIAIDVEDLLDEHESTNLDALFADAGIDALALADHIDDLLIDRSQVTLAQVCELKPLTAGLAELVTYLQLTDDRFDHALLDDHRDMVSWNVDQPDGSSVARTVNMPRVVFVRA